MRAGPSREPDQRAPRPAGGAANGSGRPAVARPSPNVLIVGGFLTEPFNYWPMRRRVLARGAASVSIAPVHVPDWLAAGVVGFGPLLVRVGRAIAKTHRAGGGRPILVVGHSAGGILARLAMSPVPFRGRRAAVADAVGALVTLGTPHGLARAPLPYAHQGLTAVRFLDAVTPGAFFAPRTAYLTVGSDLVRPEEAPARWLWDRLRGRAFTHLVGPHGALGGDGIVQLEASQLAGAEHTTFHDVRHGHIGGPWYGDDEIIERWWPRAVEAWRGALAAREAQE